MKPKDSLSKDTNETANISHPRNLSRRQFVLTGAAAATAFAIVPQHLLDGPGILDTPALVETYPAVQGEDVSQEYTVTVDGKEVPVYTAPLAPWYNTKSGQQWDPTYSFASFEFSGRVTVRISSAKPLTSLSIRP